MEKGTEGPSSMPNFTPIDRCNVSPLRGEKPQNRPLSKLNTGRLALRATLPVKTQYKHKITKAYKETKSTNELRIADGRK